MELQQGCCIKSGDRMDDLNFVNTTILIAESNESGATGFIVNQPFGRNLNELAEFNNSSSFPLYIGGPVDREHLYFIHRQSLLVSDGRLVIDGVQFGGNFSEAVEAINAGLLTTADIKIFIGYCGWDTGELEAEIVEGSWEVVHFSTDKLFQ